MSKFVHHSSGVAILEGKKYMIPPTRAASAKRVQQPVIAKVEHDSGQVLLEKLFPFVPLIPIQRLPEFRRLEPKRSHQIPGDFRFTIHRSFPPPRSVAWLGCLPRCFPYMRDRIGNFALGRKF